MRTDAALHAPKEPACRPPGCGSSATRPETSVSRRGFLGLGVSLLSLFSLVGVGRMVQAFLAAGRSVPRPDRFTVGRPEEFAPGSVTRRERVFVVRDASGLFALRG